MALEAHARRHGATALAIAVACLLVISLTAPEAAALAPKKLFGRTGVGEYQPTMDDGYTAWQQNSRRDRGHYDVFAREDGGQAFKVNRPRTNGALGDIDGGVLVYQEFGRRKSGIHFFDLTTRTRSEPPGGVNTKAWEYWPTRSGRWLVFGRSRAGRQSLILFDLETGDDRLLDTLSGGRLVPGQVNGGWVVWERCPSSGSCDVVRYEIATRTELTLNNQRARSIAPSVGADGTVVYAQAGRSCGSGVTFVAKPVQGDATVLSKLPKGIEVATSDMPGTGDGTSPAVVFDRYRCGHPLTSDAFAYDGMGRPQLSVRKQGDGAGAVTSQPNGIDCGNDCDERYALGTEVVLTATPEPGSVFQGWGGACSGNAPTCRVTLGDARSVDATFVEDDGGPTPTTSTTTPTTSTATTTVTSTLTTTVTATSTSTTETTTSTSTDTTTTTETSTETSTDTSTVPP